MHECTLQVALQTSLPATMVVVLEMGVLQPGAVPRKAAGAGPQDT